MRFLGRVDGAVNEAAVSPGREGEGLATRTLFAVAQAAVVCDVALIGAANDNTPHGIRQQPLDEETLPSQRGL